jgi:ABC-type multidrug transport system fused ATPase/permease subunit
MEKVGGLLNWIGGGISRVTATALVTALLMVAFSMTPSEFILFLVSFVPEWALNGWMRLFYLIIGLVVIFASLSYNIWSLKQKAIDDLAEDISWVIANIVNHKTIRQQYDEKAIKDFELEYQNWCSKVSKKLENRAFFTRADQLHFDRLGVVPAIGMHPHPAVNHVFQMLSLKLDRLRDVINWTQQRRH